MSALRSSTPPDVLIEVPVAQDVFTRKITTRMSAAAMAGCNVTGQALCISSGAQERIDFIASAGSVERTKNQKRDQFRWL